MPVAAHLDSRSRGVPDGTSHAHPQPHHIPLGIFEVAKRDRADEGHYDVLQAARHARCQGIVVPRADECGMVDSQPQYGT